MPQQTSPFIEGKYGWELGESGWNSGMDENLVKFSFLFDKNIDAIVNTLPTTPVNGTAYYLTTDSRLYYVVGGTYYSCPTPKWSTFQIKSTGIEYQFDGTSFVETAVVKSVSGKTGIVTLTKTDVGLGNVDNTADIIKPISTAQQTELNLKVNKSDLGSTTDNAKGSALVGYKNRTQFAKNGDLVSVEDFSTSANPLIAALASLTTGGRLLVNGAYTAASITIPAGVKVFGSGSITLTATSGDLITVGANATISDISITHASDPTGTVMVRLVGNKSGIYRCQITNYAVGVVIGTLSTLVVVPEIIDCNFFSPKVGAGNGAIWMQNFSNAIIEKNVIAGPAFPATQPDYGIRVHNGDTSFLTDNNITLHGRALWVDTPAGLHCYAMRGSGNLFDSSGTTSVGNVDAAYIAPAGNFYDTLFTNTWFGLSANASGLQVTTIGSGLVDGLTLNNCQAVGNSQAGMTFTSIGVKNFKITGGYVSANGVYGIRVGPAVSRFEIEGVTAGNVANRGANARGINIDTGASNDYIIIGNRCKDNTTFNFFDGGTGTNKIVANNLTT